MIWIIKLGEEECERRMIVKRHQNLEGNVNPCDFIDWFNDIKRVFDFHSYSNFHSYLNEKRCKIVVLKLKKHALLWWENLKNKELGMERIELNLGKSSRYS